MRLAAIFRRPLFWILFAAFSVGSAVFTFKYFSTAFPLVSLDLRMDQSDAFRAARSLAVQRGWPSQGFDQAASFNADQEAQNFIELEGGGKPELKRIIQQDIFSLYTWRVRFFQQNNAHETLVRFTPGGRPYGFRVTLPDQEKGASLSSDRALRIAEDAARNNWAIDFNRYRVVETGADARPGGRTDHTFVFERQDERVGAGRYRLRLVVGGDKLTELTHFIQIPEAFTRRYEQMRSANEAINAADSIVVFGLYILGFCAVGIFFMMRQRWIVWRPAVFWGLLLAFLLGLQQLNASPLAWMGYDTALPRSGFALRLIMSALATFGGFAVLLTVTFIAAESLSRRAFPEHVQLWKAWSRPVAASRTLLAQTWFGYLLVAPFFAYEIVLYFFAQQKLGWWSPSDALVDPDMFANYVPSLSAISQAAQAGFWEECLFRAVPLATAALIGARFGKRRAFIAGAMVLQALVFAAGHAGYANQPAYARVVELIIPSFVFGTLYLLFGLVPGIVLHFTYDSIWMSMPLFASSNLRAHVQQAIVIVAVLVPLGIVLVNRLRSHGWTKLSDDALNQAWSPKTPPEPPQVVERPAPAPTAIASRALLWLPVAGLAALALWIWASPFHADAPRIQMDRREAENRARQVLAGRSVQLDASWTALSRVQGQPGDMNRFVWQTAPRAVYDKLLGLYVTPPSWDVRFARFHGDVAQRAEEYEVILDGAGRMVRFNHQLPEAALGGNLSEAEAKAIAVAALDQRAEDETAAFKEVSAEPARRPARTDWTFVFKDERNYDLRQGEPRVQIGLAGDRIAGVMRYVYIPEDWSRTERARRNLPALFGSVCTILIVAIVAAGAIAGAIQWSRRRAFSTRMFLSIFGAIFVLNLLNVLNNWPAFAAQASTAQPLALQTGIAMATTLLLATFAAAGFGLSAGLVAPRGPVIAPAGKSIMVAVSAGVFIAGVGALARRASPQPAPLWGNLGPASAYVPPAAAVIAAVSAFLTQTLIFLIVLYALGGRRRAGFVWIFAGLAVMGSSSIDTMSAWLITGVTLGLALMLAYDLVFRHRPELLILTTATLVVLSTIRDAAQNMYPTAIAGSLAAAALVAAAAWVFVEDGRRS